VHLCASLCTGCTGSVGSAGLSFVQHCPSLRAFVQRLAANLLDLRWEVSNDNECDNESISLSVTSANKQDFNLNNSIFLKH